MKNILCLFCFFFAVILSVSGCAGNDNDSSTKAADKLPQLSCIAVLPTVVSVDNHAVNAVDKHNLTDGAAFIDTALAEELGENDKFELLNEMQLSAMLSDSWAGRMQQFQTISQATGCNGVMETTLVRYQQRVGSTMSATVPASVAFSMELVEGESGTGVWSASFNETQQALTDNIFSFKKAESRHFQWISVEQLVRDGVKSRLSHFPYFLSNVEE